MTRKITDLIEDMRNTVKPYIAKQLKQLNFENCGSTDKAEFETEFEMVLTLAEMANNQWIPCSKRLPEEKINPITLDFYEYQCTFKDKDVYDVRTYKFGKSHWWHGLSIMDNYVIAWRESPEPYKPKDGEGKG